MAESAPPAKTQWLQKTVQELAINGEELPEKYIHKDDDRGVLDVPLMEVPVVDLSLLTSSLTSREELEKLRSALTTSGCFQAINHGITNSFLDKVREVTKQFFALPVGEKQKYSREVDEIEGYGNDMILSAQQILDWTDRLYLTVNPEDQRRLKFWPEIPQDFRWLPKILRNGRCYVHRQILPKFFTEHLKDILHDYTCKMNMINEVVLKAMARSLNLEDNCFLDQYGKRPTMTARFNYYPKCPSPDLVLGAKPHADGSAITILLQDKEVEGLQFQKDNQWNKVPIIPEALLINVGDQAEIMSNGIFKSPMHRVVTNSERERISLAVFCIPESEKEIQPVDGLVNKSRPRLYKKVKNYVDIYFQNYQQGKRPIDAAKI